MITIVGDKVSPCNQALSKSGKALGTRLTFTKIEKIQVDQPYSQAQGWVTANEQF